MERKLEGHEGSYAYSVASQFSPRLSAARGHLEELQREGLIISISSRKGMKVYKPGLKTILQLHRTDFLTKIMERRQ
jgi:hypothetical protein